jgi:hypothetical protein
MSSTAEHHQLVNEIRLTLGREHDFTLWNNSKVEFVKGRARAKPGLVKGASDLVGILAPMGRMIGLEVKTGQARQTPQQKLFADLLRKRGGFACVVRSVPDAILALERARKGLSE